MKTLTCLLLLILLPVNLAAEPLIITAVGDIMLAGSAGKTFNKNGFDYPFDATRKILAESDIVSGNLEAPIALTGKEFADKKFRFKTDPKAAAALKKAGFTHLSLANNHMLDFGDEGLRQTVEALDATGIIHSGAGVDLAEARRAAVIEVKGVKVAFLSYSLTYPEEFYAGRGRAGTAPGHVSHYVADIEKARQSADCVVVSFHWGGEGEEKPKSYQIITAHKAIDAGADLVLGHHPHVLQGVEYYGEGVIFYSLGNFAFGSYSKSSDRSMIARIVFDGGVSEVEIIPLNVLNSQVGFQPRPLEGLLAKKLADRVSSLSAPFGSEVKAVNGRYLIKKNDGLSRDRIHP